MQLSCVKCKTGKVLLRVKRSHYIYKNMSAQVILGQHVIYTLPFVNYHSYFTTCGLVDLLRSLSAPTVL